MDVNYRFGQGGTRIDTTTDSIPVDKYEKKLHSTTRKLGVTGSLGHTHASQELYPLPPWGYPCGSSRGSHFPGKWEAYCMFFCGMGSGFRPDFHFHTGINFSQTHSLLQTPLKKNKAPSLLWGPLLKKKFSVKGCKNGSCLGRLSNPPKMKHPLPIFSKNKTLDPPPKGFLGIFGKCRNGPKPANIPPK